MSAPKYPMNIDTSNWGHFNDKDEWDAACERERLAFTDFMIRRMKKATTRGNSNEAAIITGSIMAIVQVPYAVHDGVPPDAARDALHGSLDFAWLMCATMADRETRQ